jgi:hypothetical protein
MQRVMRVLACQACWIAICAAPVFAQGSSVGTITGVVSDSTGAAVSGVAIEVRNVATNYTRETRTGESGAYVLPNLPVGTYEVRAHMQGFQTLVVQDVKLDVNAAKRVDIQLKPGEVSETANIEATAPLLQTENAGLGAVIEQKRVTELPLNGRNFQQLQLLTPGAVSTTNFQTGQGMAGGAGSLTTNGTMNIANGNRPGQLLFLIDGANASNQNGRGLIQQPAVDEIQEFRFQSSNMSAEFGYGSSAVIVSIKSGTNQLHGTAWEFLRNDLLDARSFFATSKEKLRRNQFGANAGGPVWIPHLYNGRDKTFWFFSYEGLRQRQARSVVASVPTARMRTGDLSEWPGQIYNPATTREDPNRPGAFLRDPFERNQIPEGKFDPVSRFFLDSAWIPLPNQPGIAANLRREITFPTDSNQITAKIDQRIGSHDTLSGRISLTRAFEGSVGPYHGLNEYDPGANPKVPHGYNFVLNYTHVFNPNNLMEARFSWSRAFVEFNTPNFGEIDYTSELGIQGFGPGVSDKYPSYPVMNITGFTGLPQGFLLNYTSNNYEYTANFTSIRGRHTFKMGNTFRQWFQDLTTSGQGSGTFNFSGNYTNNPAAPGNTGAGFADFLLGIPTSASRYVPPGWYYQRNQNNWAYFNDDWQATSHLTINLGMRYEINWPTTEKDYQFASFSPTARNGRGAILVANPQAVSEPYLQSSVPRSWPFYSQFAAFAKDVGVNERYLRDVGRHSFAPRVGFAYRVGNDTVFRGGYGIYWLQTDGNRSSEMSSVPFLIRESGILNDPFIPTRTTQTFLPAGSTYSQFATLFGHDPNATDFGYSQQWNFTIQRQLPGEFSVEAGYIGTKGTRLQTSRLINTPLPGPGVVQSRRPYPDFGAIIWNEFSASSIYHALQTKLERRFHKGLTLLGAFTWSKSIDQDSDNTEGMYDPYNARLNRGPSAFDVPRLFTLGAVYELPWLRTGRGLARAIAGSWTLGTIITLQDGFPFTPSFSGDPSNTGMGSRADVVAGCNWRLDNPTPERWFNTACFAAPPGAPEYRRGNAGRNILRGDNYHNVDLSIYKEFPFSEGRRFQLRFEAFNAFNLHSFTLPDAAVNSPNFGHIFGSSAGRILQIAGKIYF